MAAKELESNCKTEISIDCMKKILKHLDCSICNDIFENPFVINCGHTFCEKCINKWREEKDDCPLCRSDIILTSSNQVLIGIIEEYSAPRIKFLQQNSDPFTVDFKSSPLISLKKFLVKLKCLFCWKIFENPFVTNCGHTCCKKCIDDKEMCFFCDSDIIMTFTNHVLNGIIEDSAPLVATYDTPDSGQNKNQFQITFNRRDFMKNTDIRSIVSWSNSVKSPWVPSMDVFE